MSRSRTAGRGDALAGQRQVADAHPGRVGDRVADGAGDRSLGDLARAGLGFAGRVHNAHRHLRVWVNRRIG
jgi:hypothetical protein